MTENAILSFVFDRRQRSNNHTEGSIELRIYLDKKQKYISTGIKVLPKHWKNDMIVNRLDAHELNEQLDNLKSRIRKILNQMSDDGELTLDNIKNKILDKTRTDKTFLNYVEERTKERIVNKRNGTARHYITFLSWFKEWGQITLFSDVNTQKILKMDAALKKTGMKESSVYANYHKFLKAFIRDAIADGLLNVNPYQKLNISRGYEGIVQRYLTPEEFRKLENYTPTAPYLERVKDLFVFQTYTCLSYIDMASFNFGEVKNIQDVNVYSGKRVKTGIEFSFVLLKPAMTILKKYNYKLPIIRDQVYNRFLKVLAQEADINKSLSSHWARHTGATLLLNEGRVPIKIIAKILGHSTTRETEKLYAKLLDKTIVDAMMVYDEKLK